MAIILAIETSTSCGSVALVIDGKLVGEQFFNLDKSHSSLLHVMVEQLMNNTGQELKALDAIALAKGPGSYTGLRIGTSAAKGLCYALDKPLVAINTLDGLANQVSRYLSQAERLCPMLDARRMEVYAKVLDTDLNTVKETQPVILDELSFQDDLSEGSVHFFGDGATKFQEIMKHENARFINDVNPRAHDIALLGDVAYAEAAFENVIDFEPFYLKEFRTTTPKK